MELIGGLSYNYNQLPPILFSDESTVVENLISGVIWKEYDHRLSESFYNQEQRPLSENIIFGKDNIISFKKK